jgi:hypothetical protein
MIVLPSRRNGHPKPLGGRESAALSLARRNLTLHARAVANETAGELGFGHRPTEHAPSSYRALKHAFRASPRTGVPLPASSRHCGATLYLTPTDNFAWRFVHDTRHVWLGAGFTLDGELAVAAVHLARLRHAGFGFDALEHRLLYIGTVGQALFHARTRCYPIDQLGFAVRALTSELEAAIDAEFERQQEHAA